MKKSSQHPNVKVYIIIVNFNGWSDTIECLESVFRMNYNNYSVIVVDNASDDGSVEKIKMWATGKLNVWRSRRNVLRDKSFPPILKPISFVEHSFLVDGEGSNTVIANLPKVDFSAEKSFVLIESERNHGFSGGNNIGIRYASNIGDFQYIWLLNNDTVVNSNALTELVKRIRQKSKVGFCGSTLLYYYNPKKIQALAGGTYNKWFACPNHIGSMQNADRHAGTIEVEKRLFYIVGASLLVSKEVIDEVGLMSEEYFLYFEELDWVIRSRDRFSLSYAPGSLVYHKVGASTGESEIRTNKSELSDYYWTKNRLLLTRNHFPYALPTVYLSLLVAILNRIIRKQWDRVIMIMKIMFGLD
ncbi:glycosyltransferase family 2 protein [Thermodesulfobacteriota bacterium]